MAKPGRKPGGEGEFHRIRRHGTFVPDDGKVELVELDWAILALLPQQGEMIGKFIPKSLSSPEVRKALGDATLKGSVVAGRLRQLRAAGLAEPVKIPGGKAAGKGWQATPEGVKARSERSTEAQEDPSV